MHGNGSRRDPCLDDAEWEASVPPADSEKFIWEETINFFRFQPDDGPQLTVYLKSNLEKSANVLRKFLTVLIWKRMCDYYYYLIIIIIIIILLSYIFGFAPTLTLQSFQFISSL